jgi:hypothetical protein
MKNGQAAWEKAAACEAHARNTNDRILQDKFRKLRDSWIRIGNSAQFEHDAATDASRFRELSSAQAASE